MAGQGGGGGRREGGWGSERAGSWGLEVCASARAVQVRVRVRVRVHMQESVRARMCCRRCVRVFVLCKCECECACECACGLTHSEQRQVPIPHGVKRHHVARGCVSERKRVGGGWDGSSCLVRSGGLMALFFQKKMSHYGTSFVRLATRQGESGSGFRSSLFLKACFIRGSTGLLGSWPTWL